MIKEIYINDVDVSGCEKLTRVLHNCKSKQVYDKVYESCACKNNCEYKQLQRAKETIERLEESCRIWHETFERNHFMKDNKVVQLEKQIDCLKQENTILKEKLQIAANSDKETLKILQENERLKECYDGAKILNNAYIELTDKYKSALEKIKEHCIKNIENNYIDYYDEGFEENIVTEFAQDINKIIDEVLKDV